VHRTLLLVRQFVVVRVGCAVGPPVNGPPGLGTDRLAVLLYGEAANPPVNRRFKEFLKVIDGNSYVVIVMVGMCHELS